MKTRSRTKPHGHALTAAQLAEDDELREFCHAAAVRMFQMLDREEAAAGLPDPYSPGATRRRLKMKSEPKKGGVAK